MNIAGIQRTSTIDFPGTLACVLFTRGCDMNCFYCHNRELLFSGENIPAAEVLSFLQKRRGLLEGVVVSGGEPTLQPSLSGFLKLLRDMGYKVKLDTNGQRPEVVYHLCAEGLLDYCAVDWKAPETDYGSVCACPDGFQKAKQTLLILQESGVGYEARTTLYPGLTMPELLSLSAALPPLPRYRLNFFRMPESYCAEDEMRLRKRALTPGEVKAFLPELTKRQPNVILS